MIKLFVTGDIHIGKKYDSYPAIKEQLIQSRFDCLRRCVREAERQKCDYFVITGDLFDNTSRIRQKDIHDVVAVLSHFGGTVIILPGNHDYYTDEERVWKDFKNALADVDHNIRLVTKFEALLCGDGDETVTFYPAFCQAKHSSKNNLGWIKEKELDNAAYHVGLAHGSLEGLSPDMQNEYFLMTKKELNDIPVDVWLIGHTHIPYPADLSEGDDKEGYKIFNAGTPEQTDLSNNTSGVCFVVTLDKSSGKTVVSAHSYQSGSVRYYDMALQVKGGLKTAIRDAVSDLPQKSIIRLTLKGTIPSDDYAGRNHIYEETLGSFLNYEINDDKLSELITSERIRAEFAEIGFAAEFLEALSDPKEIQMAYELIKKHQS